VAKFKHNIMQAGLLGWALILRNSLQTLTYLDQF